MNGCTPRWSRGTHVWWIPYILVVQALGDFWPPDSLEGLLELLCLILNFDSLSIIWTNVGIHSENGCSSRYELLGHEYGCRMS